MQKGFKFEVLNKDSQTNARLGVIHTPHGSFETPEYTPVATTATLKALDTQDVINCGSNVVLANTYHLFLRPGLDLLEEYGGFAPFMKWQGPTITDSGGYQVSFMRSPHKNGENPEGFDGQDASIVKITDEGATFQSYVDGKKYLITPEKSMEIQAVLGADIIMAFDQPLGKDYSDKKVKEAFARTLLWEERSFARWQEIQKDRENFQALYGVVQGGTDRTLRRESLNFILQTGFPGVAIGGETIGTDPQITAESLDTIQDLWPANKPVHALGLGGGPEGVFEAVSRGIDTWDNTSVTRLARSGLLFMYPEDGGIRQNKFRVDIGKSKFKNQKTPFSTVCKCFTCQNYSAAYLHHLIISRELTGLRLASIHNVHFMNDLMQKIRKALRNNEFFMLKNEWLNVS